MVYSFPSDNIENTIHASWQKEHLLPALKPKPLNRKPSLIIQHTVIIRAISNSTFPWEKA